MTMPLITAPVGVREADLRDAAECSRLDGFVRAQPAATPFHLPAWSMAVQRGCRQRARYLVAETAGGAISGVLPLTEMRSPLFGKALVSTGFGVDGGVLGDGVEPLASGAWQLAERLGVGGVELRGGEAPADWTIDSTTYVGFSRLLAEDDEAEMKAIPKRQRAEIRRASTFDLTVTGGRDASALAEHYRLYAESVRNLGTPVFPRGLMRAVVETMDADVLTARRGNEPLSSVLNLYFNNTVFPFWGGGTTAARTWRANDHLYFALMRHAHGRGCTRFDFGRSKAGTGPAAFKKNWGFVPQPLAYARKSSGPAREVNPLNPKYALMVAMWKRLPLPIATAVGPWISRGLG
jgi:FemAB-related protein (PEP-CTERM system-associated)